jgi:hypothetical protein
MPQPKPQLPQQPLLSIRRCLRSPKIIEESDKAWLVDEIQFTAKPKVGRKTPTWRES